MAAIYSTQLWAGTLASAGNTHVTISPSPNVVVVRDMVFMNTYIEVENPLGGFAVQDFSSLIYFWNVGRPWAYSRRTYHWQGRLVLAPANTMQISTSDASWQWWISGYVLTPT